MNCVCHSAQEGVLKMKDMFLVDEDGEAIYPDMSDAEARDVYNDMAIYLDGYIYPWIKS